MTTAIETSGNKVRVVYSDGLVVTFTAHRADPVLDVLMVRPDGASRQGYVLQSGEVRGTVGMHHAWMIAKDEVIAMAERWGAGVGV